MHQVSFSDVEYSFRKRTTKREEFLKAMDALSDSQTVGKQGWKKPHSEGVANHTDPESCVVNREVGGEALTGAHAGRKLSGENIRNQGADALMHVEGNTGSGGKKKGESLSGPAPSENPRMCGSFLSGSCEASRLPSA